MHDMLITCSKFQATIGSTQNVWTLWAAQRRFAQVQGASVGFRSIKKKQINVWIVNFKCTYSKSVRNAKFIKIQEKYLDIIINEYKL